MYIVFDTETTGLPVQTQWRSFYDPKDLSKYDSARVVSISWILVDDDMKEVAAYDYLVQPDGYTIPQESINIHGITNERAKAEGVAMKEVLNKFAESLTTACEKGPLTLVAHNIKFDVNVMKAECYRYDRNDIALTITQARRYCTMFEGKNLLKMKRNPKLSALYTALYNEDITNAHDAKYDTLHCYKCFTALEAIRKTPTQSQNVPAETSTLKRELQENAGTEVSGEKKSSKMLIGKIEYELTEEQQEVITEDPTKTMLVIACAGSGKTLSIVLRIKFLIDNGVDPSSIILTTFTRDAALDMERKLHEVLGQRGDVVVGTLDSLSLRFVANDNKALNVGEYAVNFLKYLQTGCAKTDVFPHFTHLFVDEFQDINDVQYRIIKEFHNNGVVVTAVGDDAQNIYTFRGSNVKYIINFATFFPNSVQKKLTMNFRSSREIVALANASMEQNEFQIPKTMTSHYAKKAGLQPTVSYFENANQQYRYIRDKILDYRLAGYKLCQMAVLCPQNVFLYQLEEILTKSSIDNVVLDSKGEIKTKVKEDHVCLSTIHKAKGLEWDIVFLLMMNDEIFPARKGEGDIYEARRLFYVGITRPKVILNITYSQIYGSKNMCRFISEIDRKLLHFQNVQPSYFGQSETKSFKTTNQRLDALIRGIDGEDFASLKDRGIFPTEDIYRIQLYKAFDYPAEVLQHEIQNEYNAFVDCLFSKLLSEEWKGSTGVLTTYLPAVQAIVGLQLGPEENRIYTKYKSNFTYNLGLIEPFMENIYDHLDKVKSLFVSKKNNASCGPLDSADFGTVVLILRRTQCRAKEYNIPLEDVPFFTEAFLPPDFQDVMSRSYKRFCSPDVTSAECLHDIWEVSKCNAIVKERRRRLLYKDVNVHKLIEDSLPLLNHMKHKLVPYLKKQCTGNAEHIVRHYVCRDNEQGMVSDISLICDDVLYDIMCAHEDSMKAEHILHFLCQKHMYEVANPQQKVKSIGIINPLRGTIMDMDVSEFTESSKLLQYVVDKGQQQRHSPSNAQA
jgi:DNA polymerase III epsilon subunit-like protein